MTDALEAALKRRTYFTSWLSRSACAPCDRAEAGHQISRLDKTIDELNARIGALGDRS